MRHPAPTDDVWRPLRDVVPSFADYWRDYTAAESYDAEIPAANILFFAYHLVDLLGRGSEAEYAAFAVALEDLYATGESWTDHILTNGLLEDLIHVAEEADLDYYQLYEPLGTLSRERWRAAWAYTHRGKAWPSLQG